MSAETSTTLAGSRVPLADLHSFPGLFDSYCTQYESVAEFYAGDFRDPAVRAEIADRAADCPRDRDALADVLLDQNARWGLTQAVRDQIEALRNPDSVAIVTGQQVGLFAGPLYTPYKTITALQLARQLREDTGRLVIPVFWLEGEDHDLAEVAGTAIFDRNDLRTVRYSGHTPPEAGNLGPVGRLALTEQIREVIEAVDQALPPSEYKADVLEAVNQAYQPGTTLLDAFALLMRSFFPDIVFISPDDARLKRLAAPLFRREVEDFAGAQARLTEVSGRLEKRFHAQVLARPTNLFMLENGQRHPLDVEGDHFRLRGSATTFTREELVSHIASQPECFSPNVVLRPIMQDLLLPTAAYIPGPGEVSYFAQFQPIYEWAGVPMPVVYPRASVTLVEPKVRKVLERRELYVAAFADDLEKIFRRIVLADMSIDVEAMFAEAARQFEAVFASMKPGIGQVDASLARTADATRATIAKELARLKEKVVKAEKRNQETLYKQLEKAQVNLFPDGKLQERAISPLYFVAKFGTDFFRQLDDAISLDTAQHQVLEL